MARRRETRCAAAMIPEAGTAGPEDGDVERRAALRRLPQLYGTHAGTHRVCKIMCEQVDKLRRLRASGRKLPRHGGWEMLK